MRWMNYLLAFSGIHAGLFGRHAADAMKWSGAAEVAGHLQDIVLGGATSNSGLLQGRLGS